MWQYVITSLTHFDYPTIGESIFIVFNLSSKTLLKTSVSRAKYRTSWPIHHTGGKRWKFNKSSAKVDGISHGSTRWSTWFAIAHILVVFVYQNISRAIINTIVIKLLRLWSSSYKYICFRMIWVDKIIQVAGFLWKHN